MRVVIATHSFNLSGVLTQCLIYAKHLLSEGHDVLVVGNEGRHGAALLQQEGIRTVNYSPNLGGFGRDIDLIFCESLFSERIFVDITAALPRVPRVLRVHEEINEHLLAQGLWQYRVQSDPIEVLARFDLVVFPSKHTMSFYASMATSTNACSRWLMIPNTVNEEMKATETKCQRTFRVLQLGTVSPRKNPILTLMAFEMFLHDCGAADAELLFVGARNANSREREYGALLRQEVRGRDLARCVRIKSTTPSPAQDIFESSAVTLHSSSECTPTVFLEANFFGKKVVAPNVGGTAEIVTENVNGHLFGYGDCVAQARLFGMLYRQRDSLPGLETEVKNYYYRHFSNRLFFERIDAAIAELLHA